MKKYFSLFLLLLCPCILSGAIDEETAPIQTSNEELFYRANSFMKRQKPDEAAAIYEKIAETERTPNLYHNLAIAKGLSHHNEETLLYLYRAHLMKPFDQQALQDLRHIQEELQIAAKPFSFLQRLGYGFDINVWTIFAFLSFWLFGIALVTFLFATHLRLLKFSAFLFTSILFLYCLNGILQSVFLEHQFLLLENVPAYSSRKANQSPKRILQSGEVVQIVDRWDDGFCQVKTDGGESLFLNNGRFAQITPFSRQKIPNQTVNIPDATGSAEVMMPKKKERMNSSSQLEAALKDWIQEEVKSGSQQTGVQEKLPIQTSDRIDVQQNKKNSVVDLTKQ